METCVCGHSKGTHRDTVRRDGPVAIHYACPLCICYEYEPSAYCTCGHQEIVHLRREPRTCDYCKCGKFTENIKIC